MHQGEVKSIAAGFESLIILQLERDRWKAAECRPWGHKESNFDQGSWIFRPTKDPAPSADPRRRADDGVLGELPSQKDICSPTESFSLQMSYHSLNELNLFSGLPCITRSHVLEE